MKIKRLYTEDLYSYKSMEFYFDKYPGGTTLFLGRNLDQKTSNASGKSTIMKSLFFMLYGKDVAGANKDEAIRRGSSSWYGILEFEDKGHSFKIERFEGRKDKNHTGKEALNLYIDDKLFVADGIEETQKIINKKIKVTPRLFLSSVYSAQNSKHNFLVESDANKKELLSELLDLLIYEKAFKDVKEEISSLEEKIKEKENKIKINEDQIKEYDNQVKELVEKKDSFDEELSKNIVKEEDEIKKIVNKILEIESSLISKYDLTKIKEEIDSSNRLILNLENELKNESKIKVMIEKINNGIDSLTRENKELKESITEIDEIIDKNLQIKEMDILPQESLIEDLNNKLLNIEECKNEANKLNMLIQKEINTHEQLSKDLLNIEDHINGLTNDKSCPTCLREYDKNHLEHVKKELEKILEKKEKLNLEIVQSHEKILFLNKDIEKLNNIILEEKEVKEKLTLNQDSLVNLKIENGKVKIKKEENERLQAKREELNNKLVQKTNRIEVGKNKLKEVKKIEAEIESLKLKYEEEKESFKKKTEILIEAELENNKKQEGTKLINELKDNKDKHQSNIESYKNKTNPYGDMIITIEKKIEYLYGKNTQTKTLLKKETEDLKYLNFWKTGFAPTGIRSFITDDVIDLLNRKVQENINDLFNGAISVLFDPESKNNKGVVSNKISTKFFMNGKEISKETLSGGEMRRAILATDLALTEIAESRSGNKFNIRFLDEPFDGMDSNGQLQAFKLFSRLSKDKDGFFVISHDENFQNMCSNVVYILKQNEISRIVDKATFDSSDINSDKETFDSYSDNSPIETDDKKQELALKLKKLIKK